MNNFFPVFRPNDRGGVLVSILRREGVGLDESDKLDPEWSDFVYGVERTWKLEALGSPDLLGRLFRSNEPNRGGKNRTGEGSGEVGRASSISCLASKMSGHFSSDECRTAIQWFSNSTFTPAIVLEMRHSE